MTNKVALITSHDQAEQVRNFFNHLPDDWKLVVVCSAGLHNHPTSDRITLIGVDDTCFWTASIQTGIDYIITNHLPDILVIANCDVAICGWNKIQIDKYPLKCAVTVSLDGKVLKSGFHKSIIPGLHTYPFLNSSIRKVDSISEMDCVVGRCMMLTGEAITALQKVRLPAELPHYGADIIFSFTLGRHIQKKWHFEPGVIVREDTSTTGLKKLQPISLKSRINAVKTRKSVFNYQDNLIVTSILSEGSFSYQLISRFKYFIRLIRGY